MSIQPIKNVDRLVAKLSGVYLHHQNSWLSAMGNEIMPLLSEKQLSDHIHVSIPKYNTEADFPILLFQTTDDILEARSFFNKDAMMKLNEISTPTPGSIKDFVVAVGMLENQRVGLTGKFLNTVVKAGGDINAPHFTVLGKHTYDSLMGDGSTSYPGKEALALTHVSQFRKDTDTASNTIVQSHQMLLASKDFGLYLEEVCQMDRPIHTAVQILIQDFSTPPQVPDASRRR